MREAAPHWLPASALTDLSLLGAGLKPAVRLLAGDRLTDLRRWARRNGLFASSDADGFIVLSRNASTARRVLEMDRRPGRHTMALGMLLGYPACCSRAAARAGDEGIDDLQAKVSSGRFRGRFKLTNPREYANGGALLSHVPCSRSCTASLALALRFQRC